MEIFHHDLNIDFLGMRKISIAISAILIAVSLWGIFAMGLNYGMDFTGGILLDVSYQQPIKVSDVRGALTKAGYPNAIVQSVGGSREFSIRLQPPKVTGGKNPNELAGEASKKIITALQVNHPQAKLAHPPNFVGPEVGKTLKTHGIYAVIVVVVLIMLYLGMRFEKRFAVAALASEVHDTIIIIGFLAITRQEFDMTALAAVLAMVGYSINDKVVVFDRVRELFRLTRKAKSQQILNRAINNTLSRTVITASFTALAMAALFVLGGPTVHVFSLTMLIGILIGTLSSIFFASPVLLWLGVSKKDLMPVSKTDPELQRRP